MRHSEMNAEQRALLDDPESYPMRVRFLGKTGTLSFTEVQFLRENGVDFELATPEEERSLLARLVDVAAALFGALLLLWRGRPRGRRGK
ncbi:MAG: hypothetical protein ACOX6T_03130 [Myxococcales bacterium]|jgi:hypothetical protein